MSIKLFFAFSLATMGYLLEIRNLEGLPTMLDALTCWILIGAGVLFREVIEVMKGE